MAHNLADLGVSIYWGTKINYFHSRKSRAGAVYSTRPALRLIYFISMVLQLTRNRGGTPSSNTGLNSQAQVPDHPFTVRLDWLQLRLLYNSMPQLQQICDRINSLFDDLIDLDFERSGFMGRRFDFTGQSVRGCRLYCDMPGDTPGRCLLVIPGRVLKLATMAGIHELCQQLQQTYSAVATRLDVALDDHTKSLRLQDLLEAGEAQNYALVSSVEHHRRRASRGQPWGESVVFGSPQSDKRVIFYDKEVESNGEICSIRMEARLRNFKADQVFQRFCTTELSEVSSDLVDIVTGAVDFLDRTSGDKNLKRLPRLGFWQSFLDFVLSHPVKIPSKKREISYEKSLNWLEFAVSPTLCIMRKVLGIASFHDKMNRFIDEANNRLTPQQQKTIRVYRSDLALA